MKHKGKYRSEGSDDLYSNDLSPPLRTQAARRIYDSSDFSDDQYQIESQHYNKRRLLDNDNASPKEQVSKELKNRIELLSSLCDALSGIISDSKDPSIKRRFAEIKLQYPEFYSGIQDPFNRFSNQPDSVQLADYVVDLRNYKKIKNIQDGGFGTVYCAREKKTNIKYAVKVLKTSCSDPDDQRYFLREVGIFASMTHPAVLPFKGFALYDLAHERNPAIITEFMEKGSLDDFLENELKGNSSPDWNNTHRMMALLGITAGMGYLHSRNVIHRDLKPGNVLLNNRFEPFITDFGLSKVYKAGKSMSQSMFCGTPLWMAPELLKEEPFGPKVDVYAFSMIAYQVLAKKLPFGKIKQFELQRKVIAGTRPSLHDIPEQFRSLIDSCWSPDPDKRPAFSDILPLFLEEKLMLPGVNLSEYHGYVRRLGLGKSEIATCQISLKDQADAGLPKAQYEYGHQLKEGIGVKRNVKLAAKYLRKSTEQDHPLRGDALAELGDLYLNGDGVPEDLEMAAQCFEESARLGCGKGQNSYGCALAHGWGVTKNKTKAAKYFKQSADSKYPWGQFNYGMRLQRGIGVEKNISEAIKYFRLARDQGIDDAKVALEQLGIAD